MRPLVSSLLSLKLVSVAQGHSWIDCLTTDRSKLYDQSASYIFGGAGGNGFCDGYGAGYPGRGDIDIGTEYTYKILKNEADAGAPVCENVGANTYTGWRKRLRVKPGQIAYFGYLPNGHIVKDKKAVGTQYGIYWTGQVGTSLTSTREMTPENLIDGRTHNFDDHNCGEAVDFHGNPSHRAGDGKPCVGSFTLPEGTAPGIYNLVWYWKFWLDDQSAYVDQEMAKGYFGAAYSTCFEVEVVPSEGEVGIAQTLLQTLPFVGFQSEVGNDAVQMPPSSPPAASPVQLPPSSPPAASPVQLPPSSPPAASPVQLPPSSPPAASPVQLPEILAASAPDVKTGPVEIPTPSTPLSAHLSDEAAPPAKVKPAEVSKYEMFSPPASELNGAGCRSRFRSSVELG